MVFSSVTFLFYFLPLFLALYFLLPWRNIVLLSASLIFYAWGEIEFVFLLILSICLNFFAALAIDRATSQETRKWRLLFGLSINLALLGYFKYADFVWSGIFGLDKEPTHLPLGISFFTFQAVSYLIDVYRRQITAEGSIVTLGTYIAMFPQLVAGPIVRFQSIVHELHGRQLSLDKAVLGFRIFSIGLAQKVLIANTVAGPADYAFALSDDRLWAGIAWLGAISYTFQIYFDFAGYSNMAIGLGLVMGLTLPQNFNYPYISKSITEFWRRWHISLSTWFRDYVYIPLGGNRMGPKRTYFNLLVVFVLCGFWHGAAWTFLFWGLYQGAFLVLERLGWGAVLDQLWAPLRHLYVGLVVVFGWVLFRSETFEGALGYAAAMLGWGQGQAALEPLGAQLQPAVIAALVIAVFWSTPVFRNLLADLEAQEARGTISPPRWMDGVTGILLFGVSLSVVSLGGYDPFIYFRF